MLQWMWQGAREYAWVAESGSTLTGYTFGRHGHDYEHLGPITRRGRRDGATVGRGVPGPRQRPSFVVDVGPGQSSWQQSLEALGFRLQRPLIRMARGSGDIPGDPSRQFAVLGPEFG